ncbi:hypothetical protein MTsPCn5_20670 [Croceitalea sp. MTPC5]|uniref:hypothetical protein n=1 Tax=Croceitalea sp. MTPC5 TaxID=3056565 RepID=UPI002B3CE32B|nr:hypothetical protein MTsPCn5_20670 [Croceitalea sp. MTPC5]
MNTIEIASFNPIGNFMDNDKSADSMLISKKNCDQKHHGDFYCDAEKPFVANF